MLAGVLTNGRRLIHVPPGAESEEELLLVDEALALFDRRRIQLHSNYDEYFIVREGDAIIAAAATSVTEDDTLSYEFSIAVDEARQRQGLMRHLVEEVIKYARSLGDELDIETWVEGYVVNPDAVLPLLKSMGFTLQDKYWRLKVRD